MLSYVKKVNFVLPSPWRSVELVKLFPWLSKAELAAEEIPVEVTSEPDVFDVPPVEVTEGFRNSKLTLRLKLAKSPM